MIDVLENSFREVILSRRYWIRNPKNVVEYLSVIYIFNRFNFVNIGTLIAHILMTRSIANQSVVHGTGSTQHYQYDTVLVIHWSSEGQMC